MNDQEIIFWLLLAATHIFCVSIVVMVAKAEIRVRGSGDLTIGSGVFAMIACVFVWTMWGVM